MPQNPENPDDPESADDLPDDRQACPVCGRGRHYAAGDHSRRRAGGRVGYEFCPGSELDV